MSKYYVVSEEELDSYKRETDPNCDVNVVTLRIADLLDILPKLLAVVEAAKRLDRDTESGYRLWDLQQALATLEEV